MFHTLSVQTILLFAGAAALTASGSLWKKAGVLAYAGGFLWAGGTVSAAVDGAPLSVLLLFTLLMLGLASRGRGGGA